MAIITVSRGSYSSGKEIAQKVAQKLGYDCISREDILNASEEFNIPDIKLIHAFEDAPSILDHIPFGREKFIAYIRAALLKHLKKDNMVYHGFACHFFVKDIPRVLNVRIITEVKKRLEIVMQRENISRKKALRYVQKVDEQRRKWSRKLYGTDPRDPSLYDLVLRINKITVEDAVHCICKLARLEQFQSTPETKREMEDLALAAAFKAFLTQIQINIDVAAKDGIVYLKTESPLARKSDLGSRIEEIAKAIPGIRGINFVAKKVTHHSYLYLSQPGIKSIRDTIPTFFGDL